MQIPILDSLAHPTLSGDWLGAQQTATFEKLAKKLKTAHFKGACAIGMADLENYEHEAFFKKCQTYPNLIPIAGFNPIKSKNIENELIHIAQLGFKGIKIHPRFSKITLTKFDLSSTFQKAAELNLPVFYCTYMHCGLAHYPSQDPFYNLVELLKKAPNTKVILVHGGDVQVLRYAELVRFNTNLLLDLSLTILKYEGSSVDADIQFLFKKFDRRICIGTDFPEYSPQQLRERFEHFSKDLFLEKKENIAWRNLSNFLKG